MNKLVLLSDVRKEKKENNCRLESDNSIKSNDDYINFKNKFWKTNTDLFSDEIYSKFTVKLNNIFKRLFYLNNKIPFIDLLNNIYDDYLSYNSEVSYLKSTSDNNISIKIKDGYKSFEYSIEFKCCDFNNIALMINKNVSDKKFSNVINFNKKRDEYKYKVNEDKKIKVKSNNSLYVLVLNSDIEVPDRYQVDAGCGSSESSYELDIFKGWRYDFKMLYEKKMYLIFPLKIFDLKNRINDLLNYSDSKLTAKDEIVRFFSEMNRYFNKVKQKKLLSQKDIDELNLITRDFLNEFMKEKKVFI